MREERRKDAEKSACLRKNARTSGTLINNKKGKGGIPLVNRDISKMPKWGRSNVGDPAQTLRHSPKKKHTKPLGKGEKLWEGKSKEKRLDWRGKRKPTETAKQETPRRLKRKKTQAGGGSERTVPSSGKGNRKRAKTNAKRHLSYGKKERQAKGQQGR